jgi:hypothetical protein
MSEIVNANNPDSSVTTTGMPLIEADLTCLQGVSRWVGSVEGGLAWNPSHSDKPTIVHEVDIEKTKMIVIRFAILTVPQILYHSLLDLSYVLCASNYLYR